MWTTNFIRVFQKYFLYMLCTVGYQNFVQYICILYPERFFDWICKLLLNKLQKGIKKVLLRESWRDQQAVWQGKAERAGLAAGWENGFWQSLVRSISGSSFGSPAAPKNLRRRSPSFTSAKRKGTKNGVNSRHYGTLSGDFI